MEFKAGDKLVCIKNYGHFLKNNYYKITIENGKYYKIIIDNYWFQYESKNTPFYLYEFFVSLQEFRKMKLKQIENGSIL